VPRRACLTALIALLAIAGGAAVPANGAEPMPIPIGFKVEGSNGYSVFVFGVQARHGRPTSVGIVATHNRSEAIYFAPATVTDTSIEADLGALGEIAVTFRTSGRARSMRSRCGDRPVSFDAGHYEGAISFHGEEGYTEVEAQRGSGDVRFLLDLLCPGIGGGSGGPFMPGAELDVDPLGTGLGPDLKIVKNSPDARAHFEAGISEKHDGIAISRHVQIFAPPGSFEYDSNVRTATVRPPAPFSGTGRFRRTARRPNRWTGDLTVDLPGNSNVRLTGGDLRARLVHARWDLTSRPSG